MSMEEVLNPEKFNRLLEQASSELDLELEQFIKQEIKEWLRATVRTESTLKKLADKEAFLKSLNEKLKHVIEGRAIHGLTNY